MYQSMVRSMTGRYLHPKAIVSSLVSHFHSSLFSFSCPLLLDLIHDPSSSQMTPLLPAIEDVHRPFLCPALVGVAGDSIARRKTGVIAFDDERRMKEGETGLLILPSIDVLAKATILWLAKRLSLWRRRHRTPASCTPASAICSNSSTSRL